MKVNSRIFAVTLAIALVASLAVPAVAQTGFAKIKGVVTDRQGKPISGASVDMANKENGAKYHFKTNAKGEYFSIGIQPGSYKMTLKDPAGTVLWTNDDVRMSLAAEDEMNEVNINLANEEAAAVLNNKAGAAGEKTGAQPVDTNKLTPEQKKQIEEYNKQKEQITKENAKRGNLNQMLIQSREAVKAGNPDQGITLMAQATQMDPNIDLLWGALGDAHLAAATKAPTPADRTPHYTEAVTAYKKAIDLASAAPATNGSKPVPADTKKLAGYYNNYAQALSKTGQVQPAIDAWEKAAQIDPAGAATYYYNEGAIFTNTGKADLAAEAFDKCVKADPNRADAYYLKGTALLSKAKLNADGTMTAVPGTAESFNKYLELAPQGPYAEQAKQLLASIGAKIETSYKKGKTPPKK